MRERTPQQKVDAGQRIRNFLADEAVAEALMEIERLNYTEFVSSTTPEARQDAWAKAAVLGDFNARLLSFMEDGERTRVEILAREARTPAPVAR